MKDIIAQQNAQEVKNQLNSIDIDSKITELEREIPRLSKSKLDNAVKQLKYLKALKASNLKAGDAYVISKIPVVPPSMRPFSVSESTGTYMISGPNLLYRDLILTNEALRDAKKAGLPDKDISKARANLYQGLSAVQGLVAPNSPQLQNKDIKGFMSILTGGSGKQPKEGYVQSNLLSRNLDFTGRGTASPDPSLAIDQIGLPESQAWTLFEPFVMRKLTQRGFSPLDAEDQIKKRSDLARKLLIDEMADRPVLINRAPTLWRTNIVAAYPKIAPGKGLKIQPLIEEGMNLDYDGDAATIHVPVTREAVEEAKNMTIRTNVFTDKSKDDLIVKPSQEPILGLYKATQVPSKSKKVVVFQNTQEAVKAYQDGKIELDDPIEIRNP